MSTVSTCPELFPSDRSNVWLDSLPSLLKSLLIAIPGLLSAVYYLSNTAWYQILLNFWEVYSFIYSANIRFRPCARLDHQEWGGSILTSGKLKGRFGVFRAREFRQRLSMMWFICEWNPSGCHSDNILTGWKENGVRSCVVIWSSSKWKTGEMTHWRACYASMKTWVQIPKAHIRKCWV